MFPPSRVPASVLALALPLSLGVAGVPAAQAAEGVRQIVVLAEATDDVAGVAADLLGPLDLVVDHVWRDALDGFSVSAPAAALADLLDDPRVALVEQAGRVHLSAQSLPVGIDRIDADQQPAAGIGTGANVDVDVAVIDTGIADHADLNLASHFNCVSGLFSSGCKAGGSDGHGHGTHVAGTIGALDNGLDVVGVAPGARMHGYKVLNDLLGSGSTADIIDAIDHVTARGDIEVINMSLGGSGSSSATDQAIAGATAAGVVVVVAAGNDSADASGYTPANSPNAITVSAITDTDGQPGGLGGSCSGADDTLATYSNHGAVVDIAAPGSCIVSLRPGGGTAQMSGTSMASPHVAGGAALWIAAHGTPASSSRWNQVLAGLTTTWGAAQDGPCGYATTRNADPLLHLTGCGAPPVEEPPTEEPPVEEEPAVASSIGEVRWVQGSLLFGGRYADVTLTVVDEAGAPLSAAVTADVLRDGTLFASHSGTTSSNGTITFQNDGVPDGTYSVVVTAVTAEDHPFDGETPDNGVTVTTSRGWFG